MIVYIALGALVALIIGVFALFWDWLWDLANWKRS